MVDMKALPNDASVLKKMLLEYSGRIDTLENTILNLSEQNRLYRDQLFGRKSEKTRPDNDPNQPSLFDELEETYKEEPDSEEVTTVVHSHTIRQCRFPESWQRSCPTVHSR